MLTVLLLVALSYYIIVRNEKQAKTKTCIKLGELLAYSLGLGGALVLLFPEPLQGRWLLDFLLSLAAALVGILFYRFVVRIAEGAQMSRRTYETDPGYGWKSFFSAVSAISSTRPLTMLASCASGWKSWWNLMISAAAFS